MQQSLFDNNELKSQLNNELIISKVDKNALTKPQRDFNKLVSRLETLRAEMEQTTMILEHKLASYVADVFPAADKVVALRSNAVNLLFPFYSNSTFSEQDKKHLGALITGFIDDVAQLTYGNPDDELKEIYEEINGVSFDEKNNGALAAVNKEMEDMLRELDMDVEESLTLNITEAELKQQIEEMKRRKANRKKTKKELEKEERDRQIEEIKSKNINIIYKQLVKVFHPDLEHDPEEKLRKEEIMKQITIAYEKGDLVMLLRLEMEWIQKESNNTEKLDDYKLVIYNDVLKEQAEDLEFEIDNLFNQSRYIHLHRFAKYPSQLKSVNFINEKKWLENTAAELEKLEAQLKADAADDFVLSLVKMYAKGMRGRK